jgi:Ca2+-binding EF-hand superfamily protein
MARLADKYTTSHGLVDYLSCFRTYLTAISQKPPPEPKATDDKHDKGGGADVKCHHPWDFDYIRSKSAGPYWTSATAAPRDFSEVAEKAQASKAAIPSLAKRVSQLSAEEVAALKSQYTEKCCQAAKKVHSQVYPSGNWRQMKNEFRSLQVNSQKGNILTTTFYQLMQKYGVKLSISEMHSLVKELRGTGNQDVVKYEEFLRLCSVCDA